MNDHFEDDPTGWDIQEMTGNDEMSRTADRQELRETLDQAKQDRVQIGQANPSAFVIVIPRLLQAESSAVSGSFHRSTKPASLLRFLATPANPAEPFRSCADALYS